MASGSESGKIGSGARRGTTAAMNRSPQRGGGMRLTNVPQGNSPF